MGENVRAKHPLWSDSHLTNRYNIYVQNRITGKCRPFEYYMSGALTDQNELRDFFQIILKDSYDAGTLNYDEYINEFEDGEDTIRSRDTYQYMKTNAEKLQFVDPHIEFDECWGMDGADICDNRITFYYGEREAPTDDDILEWDENQWVPIRYETEWVGHPGGESTSNCAPCWVDREMGYPREVPNKWTFDWECAVPVRTKEENYGLVEPKVQLINPLPSEDDDYYLTI